jgi:uncharacterized membrane protein YeaQ/YmgE (transglycosylase-associated protein family)
MFNILGLLFVGLVIGFLARLLLPGKQKIGLLWTVGLGVAGALIGGIIASALNTGDVFELNFIGFIAALVASVGLVGMADRAGLGQDDKKRLES